MLKRTTSILLVLIAALALAACGDDDSSTSESGTTDAKTTATESTTASPATTDGGEMSSDGATVLELTNVGNELKFDKTELTAKAGKVTINLSNDSSIPHNIGIKQDGEKVGPEGELVASGETSTITADLKPGTYEFYCSPHETAGMKGTLTIT